MFPLNPNHLPKSVSSLFSAYASFTAFKFLIQTVVNELKEFIPPWVRSYIYSKLRKYFFKPRPNDKLTLVINKNIGMAPNEVYDKVEVYLGSKISPSDSRLELSKTSKQKSVSLAIEKRGQDVQDTFDDIDLRWTYVAKSSKKCRPNKFRPPSPGDDGEEESHYWSFELSFDRKHRAQVIDSYMPYVLAQAESIKQGERVLKLHSTGREQYGPSKSCIDLVHPATFETMAMDPELKKMIIDDLDRFVKRRELYKKVGKAWKRGYLLYGPPGTGKSSLIAAMANYLKFDIYDLELSSIYGDSELRRVLLSTSNRSIVVVEDIDCSVQIKNRESAQPSKIPPTHPSRDCKFTLSGLLNFIDGLWSCCGDERIIVFTTNHKERLDPALLRPGRMDLHIHLSYCTPSGFRILASNYLGIHESSPHHLFGEIESLIESTEVTPAAVAEELMKSDDADVVLEGLVKFLKEKKAADDKMKSKKAKKAEQERMKKAEEEGSKSGEEEGTNKAEVGGSKKGNEEATKKAEEVGTEKGKEEGTNKTESQERDEDVNTNC
ncbi:putative ATPase, AAA-type, core, AAA-type ATPase domain-containing protein [Rosa chinensis]|uniref:Putative ATPase, AAA-type, core, AAA-type ATPase domain-containing protein n=3 Tax=Rosa chinensis TaxID=74649 RepID=A0A2P6RM84_ROSCH|nr:putative ATPase, AAA-type, core, AAA-type ATPase domain-containing protein [Rosa chinensis]